MCSSRGPGQRAEHLEESVARQHGQEDASISFLVDDRSSTRAADPFSTVSQPFRMGFERTYELLWFPSISHCDCSEIDSWLRLHCAQAGDVVTQWTYGS